MKVLVDSHTLLWASDDPAKVPAPAMSVLQNPANELLISLPFHHRDPFDRLLVSQALSEGTPLVSGDAIFDVYGVKRIWK
jgi:PIN domain nuclease of toxin-antitoxin system